MGIPTKRAPCHYDQWEKSHPDFHNHRIFMVASEISQSLRFFEMTVSTKEVHVISTKGRNHILIFQSAKAKLKKHARFSSISQSFLIRNEMRISTRIEWSYMGHI